MADKAIGRRRSRAARVKFLIPTIPEDENVTLHSGTPIKQGNIPASDEGGHPGQRKSPVKAPQALSITADLAQIFDTVYTTPQPGADVSSPNDEMPDDLRLRIAQVQAATSIEKSVNKQAIYFEETPTAALGNVVVGDSETEKTSQTFESRSAQGISSTGHRLQLVNPTVYVAEGTSAEAGNLTAMSLDEGERTTKALIEAAQGIANGRTLDRPDSLAFGSEPSASASDHSQDTLTLDESEQAVQRAQMQALQGIEQARPRDWISGSGPAFEDVRTITDHTTSMPVDASVSAKIFQAQFQASINIERDEALPDSAPGNFSVNDSPSSSDHTPSSTIQEDLAFAHKGEGDHHSTNSLHSTPLNSTLEFVTYDDPQSPSHHTSGFAVGPGPPTTPPDDEKTWERLMALQQEKGDATAWVDDTPKALQSSPVIAGKVPGISSPDESATLGDPFEVDDTRNESLKISSSLYTITAVGTAPSPYEAMNKGHNASPTQLHHYSASKGLSEENSNELNAPSIVPTGQGATTGSKLGDPAMVETISKTMNRLHSMRKRLTDYRRQVEKAREQSRRQRKAAHQAQQKLLANFSRSRIQESLQISGEIIALADRARSAQRQSKKYDQKLERAEDRLMTLEERIENREREFFSQLHWLNPVVTTVEMGTENSDEDTTSQWSTPSGSSEGQPTHVREYYDAVGEISIIRERLNKIEIAHRKALQSREEEFEVKIAERKWQEYLHDMPEQSEASFMNKELIANETFLQSFLEERASKVDQLLRTEAEARELRMRCVASGEELDEDGGNALEEALRYNLEGAIGRMYAIGHEGKHLGITPLQLIRVKYLHARHRTQRWLLDMRHRLLGMSVPELEAAANDPGPNRNFEFYFDVTKKDADETYLQCSSASDYRPSHVLGTDVDEEAAAREAHYTVYGEMTHWTCWTGEVLRDNKPGSEPDDLNPEVVAPKRWLMPSKASSLPGALEHGPRRDEGEASRRRSEIRRDSEESLGVAGGTKPLGKAQSTFPKSFETALPQEEVSHYGRCSNDYVKPIKPKRSYNDLS